MKELKQARTSDGATHFLPAIAAQGSAPPECWTVSWPGSGMAERAKKRVASEASERANTSLKEETAEPKSWGSGWIGGAISLFTRRWTEQTE